MKHIAKIFMNGRSQAVRLPKDFRFDCDEVFVRRQGDDIIISPKKQTWDDFFDQESAFDEEFMNDRDQNDPQNRDFY
ncbi:MAG: type II toxin-antitoxin system VapB family antitoxin [Pseudomonadales bacterium]